MTKYAWLLLVLFFAAFLGCARQVVRGQNHGVVAIPSNSNTWPFRYRDEAHQIMSEHFPEGYEIEHEEEVVVGQTTRVDSDTDTSKVKVFGPLSVGAEKTRITERTKDDTEWRIYYRRR